MNRVIVPKNIRPFTKIDTTMTVDFGAMGTRARNDLRSIVANMASLSGWSSQSLRLLDELQAARFVWGHDRFGNYTKGAKFPVLMLSGTLYRSSLLSWVPEEVADECVANASLLGLNNERRDIAFWNYHRDDKTGAEKARMLRRFVQQKVGEHAPSLLNDVQRELRTELLYAIDNRLRFVRRFVSGDA